MKDINKIQEAIDEVRNDGIDIPGIVVHWVPKKGQCLKVVGLYSKKVYATFRIKGEEERSELRFGLLPKLLNTGSIYLYSIDGELYISKLLSPIKDIRVMLYEKNGEGHD